MKFSAFVLFGLVGIIAALPHSADRKLNDDKYMHHYEQFIRKKRNIVSAPKDNEEINPEYWNQQAQQAIQEQLSNKPIEGLAKNVILFLGDGMSIATLTAARTYQEQIQGKSKQNSKLSFEEFPFTGLSKTYCVDKQVADSACSATAYLCGIKANSGTIGVSAAVNRKDCRPMNNQTNHVKSISRWSQLVNKATGIVTTTRITHASPSGTYAHTAERDWESDFDVEEAGQNATECLDIATQLIYGETGMNFDVILGGGRKKFLPKDHIDEEGQLGERLDGINLIDEWKKIRKLRGQNAEYVWNRKQLLKIDDNTNKVLGLFDADHCPYYMNANPETEPTLAEMTMAAIKVLSKNPNGYFLFVEGGRIDHAHHDTKAHLALDETIQFSEAIRQARLATDLEDTLIVVTSDHAHTMSLSGYAERGNDIFGIAGTSEMDHLPYATLSYANGPGYKGIDETGKRYDISKDNMDDKDYKFPSIAPLKSETHGGDDVAIFASGPWAHLFVGLLEQNVIPHVMAYASCVGSGATVCDKK